jgi:hypothetical protein
MNIDSKRYQSLTEIYEVSENIVEVVRSVAPPVIGLARSAEGIGALVPNAREFRVIARRVLRGSNYKYLARIEELKRLEIDDREACLWRDVTHLFSTSDADTASDCIDLALGSISALQGKAHVFEDPNF